MKTIIEYTNARLKAWYSNVKSDFGVIGSGIASYDRDTYTFVINYTEDGVKREWSMFFHPEYIQTKPLDWAFNCWAEGAFNEL